MASDICLVLHRKSANELPVKEAVQHVRSKGIKLRVRIPWNKKDKPRVVQEALEAGAKRIIAGGGDGTINAVVNALVGKGKKRPRATLGVLPLGTANDSVLVIGSWLCARFEDRVDGRWHKIGSAEGRWISPGAG